MDQHCWLVGQLEHRCLSGCVCRIGFGIDSLLALYSWLHGTLGKLLVTSTGKLIEYKLDASSFVLPGLPPGGDHGPSTGINWKLRFVVSDFVKPHGLPVCRFGGLSSRDHRLLLQDVDDQRLLLLVNTNGSHKASGRDCQIEFTTWTLARLRLLVLLLPSSPRLAPSPLRRDQLRNSGFRWLQ